MQQRVDGEPVVGVRDVVAGYGGRAVLHGVSTSVARGELVTLLGANGSGKSTLIRTMIGLVPVRGGQVTVFGVAVRRFRGGVLLVSALMIVPVATAQQVARSFRATCALALLLGASVSVGGGIVSYEADLASGPTIVLCALAVFAVVLVLRGLFALTRCGPTRRGRRAPAPG